MSQVTDVLVSIDTKTIVDRYGRNNSLNNPPLIDFKHVFMRKLLFELSAG